MLIRHFLNQVQKNQEAVAVKSQDGTMTYSQLDAISNKVANCIIKHSADKKSSEEKAALLFEHGPGMIVGTIGALKADRIYVPFDPYYPEDRLLYMLDHSTAELIITNDRNVKLAETLASSAKRKVSIMNIDNLDNDASDKPVAREAKGERLAYILYTSGSTGIPKGVMQNHKNVLYFVSNYIERHNIRENDRLTLFSAFSHDAAVIDIFSGLLSGATLYPMNVRRQIPIERLHEWLLQEEITIWHSVPTLYRYFVNTLTGEEKPLKLRNIILGGESVTEQDVVKYRKHFNGVGFVNLYGQSESSYNSSQVIADEDDYEGINLGEAINGSRLVVINDKGRIAAPFSTGEIAVASECLALGYWNDAAKTEMSFENHPELGRIYRTGDLGRYNEDNFIEYIGRKDFQIKINGYRVELEEIESCLQGHKDIKDAAVVGKADEKGVIHLYGYYTSDKMSDAEAVREFISNKLPYYMIPAFITRLESLPLTPTGKVDRRALSELNVTGGMNAYEAPRCELEEQLVHIWEEILEIENPGIRDNFFARGGHSLKAASLSARIYKELKVEIPLGEIFKSPTISQLAAYIKSLAVKQYVPIEKVEDSDCYELSSSQMRMFIMQQMDQDSTSYNMPKAFIIEGELNTARLEAALKTLVNRHEVLRTSFMLRNENITQIIHPEVIFETTIIKASEAEVERIVESFIHPFDLSRAPLFRVALIELSNKSHMILFDIHHIISDGISMDIFIRELISLYRGRTLPALKIQYKDFSAWQKNRLNSETMIKQEVYWLEHLKGEISQLDLPTDFQRPMKQSYEGNIYRFGLEPDSAVKIKAMAEAAGATLYMALLSAYYILLYKYTEQEGIIIGSPVAGRGHPDIENIIGLFMNTLAIRNNPKGSKTVTAFLEEVKENAIRAYENQEYPFEELVKKLNIKRDISRNPLFDTLFSMQTIKTDKFEIDGLAFTPFEFENRISKFDLSLIVVETEKGIELAFEYCTKLFTEATIKRLAGDYLLIVKQMTEKQDRKLADISILTLEEKQRILYEFNKTNAVYPKEAVIHELFEKQAALTPECIALVYHGRSMTYKELNERSNQLARVLRKTGVGPESIVGIMVRRSFHMIIGILAVLKAGGAYVPIDPEYPAERIEYMLRDSGTDILLIGNKDKGKFTFLRNCIEVENEHIYTGTSSNLGILSRPENLAYIIYTSGSTGRPKGTMIEHKSVVNFICSMKDKMEFKPGQSILALTTISFDIFLLETLAPLAAGLKVVIADEQVQMDSKLLLNAIDENGIDIIQATPSRMHLLLQSTNNLAALKKLKVIMIGGEAFPLQLLKELKTLTDAKIFNMYGPTETTVWSCTGEQTDVERIDIGKPISNTRIYIVDKDGNLKHTGITGELCIAGDGLARGYLNRAELTGEKFVPDPFVPGEKMYRTGDKARFLQDGRIEFAGRNDGQVKVRGYRIELEEIKSCLKSCPGVQEAVVIDKKNEDGILYLAAYYTAASEISVTALREDLGRSIPDYMIPQTFMFMEKLPLTPNGKLDKNALSGPDYKRPMLLSEYRGANNEIETVLVNIWKDLLQLELVGVNDNFFDLGGNSMRLVKMHAAVDKQYPQRVKIADIFAQPTIAKLSKLIESNSGDAAEGLRLRTIQLPADYFGNRGSDAGESIYLNINRETYDQLLEMADVRRVSISDILLAAFVYVIYELSDRSNVPVNAERDASGQIMPLYFQMNSIKSIEDLVSMANEKQCRFKISDALSKQQLGKVRRYKERTEVLLKYEFNCFKEQNENTDLFDITLKAYADSGTCSVFFEYDTGRMISDKIKELLYYYGRTIESIVERML